MTPTIQEGSNKAYLVQYELRQGFGIVLGGMCHAADIRVDDIQQMGPEILCFRVVCPSVRACAYPDVGILRSACRRLLVY